MHLNVSFHLSIVYDSAQEQALGTAALDQVFLDLSFVLYM
jgi:hypothetical protein